MLSAFFWQSSGGFFRPLALQLCFAYLSDFEPYQQATLFAWLLEQDLCICMLFHAFSLFVAGGFMPEVRFGCEEFQQDAPPQASSIRHPLALTCAFFFLA